MLNKDYQFRYSYAFDEQFFSLPGRFSLTLIDTLDTLVVSIVFFSCFVWVLILQVILEIKKLLNS